MRYEGVVLVLLLGELERDPRNLNDPEVMLYFDCERLPYGRYCGVIPSPRAVSV